MALAKFDWPLKTLSVSFSVTKSSFNLKGRKMVYKLLIFRFALVFSTCALVMFPLYGSISTDKAEGHKCISKSCNGGIPDTDSNGCEGPHQNSCITYSCTRCNGFGLAQICWAEKDNICNLDPTNVTITCGAKSTFNCSVLPGPTPLAPVQCGCGDIPADGGTVGASCVIRTCSS